MALPILLDCDPGHDDAIAIVLALASPELDVKAITSSAGNQTPEKTLRNVLRMLTLLNRTDIPVAGGAVKPLMRELIIADNVHGESGLDGPALPEPTFAPQNCTAVELMAKTLRESAEPVTIVSTGPQTNVALLLNSHPELHSKIARIVIMGGAMGLGNWTPAAEFNIYVDPEAAEIVFQSGIDPEMINEVLDVMVELANEGMTMMVVTHEMGFARKVANRVIFMDEGKIVEDSPKDAFFDDPKSDRAKDFLAKILH